MPSIRYDQAIRPYNARVTLCNRTYYLGCFRTRGEASDVERDFKFQLHKITLEAHTMWAIAAGLQPQLELAVG